MRIVSLLAAVMLFATGSVALAQVEPPVEVVYPERTVLVLDGHTVDGTVEGPSGTLINIRKKTRFGNMILVRQSFAMELLGSANNL